MFTSLLFTLALAALVSSRPSSLLKRQNVTQKAQIISKCTLPNMVALTFDDGPYLYLEDVGNTLTAAKATGTFFFNGNNYACIYDAVEMTRVKYVFAQGHQVASHTWAHKDLTLLTSAEINDEMSRVELALQRIVGVVPAFMRPPYGNYNDLLLEIAYSRGQSAVLWDFDSGDSLNATVAQSEKSYDDLILTHPVNILALNHEVYETTAHQLLPYAIQKLQAAGYKLVSLAECLGMAPYQSTVAAGVPDATWTCT